MPCSLPMEVPSGASGTTSTVGAVPAPVATATGCGDDRFEATPKASSNISYYCGDASNNANSYYNLGNLRYYLEFEVYGHISHEIHHLHWRVSNEAARIAYKNSLEYKYFMVALEAAYHGYKRVKRIEVESYMYNLIEDIVYYPRDFDRDNDLGLPSFSSFRKYTEDEMYDIAELAIRCYDYDGKQCPYESGENYELIPIVEKAIKKLQRKC